MTPTRFRTLLCREVRRQLVWLGVRPVRVSSVQTADNWAVTVEFANGSATKGLSVDFYELDIVNDVIDTYGRIIICGIASRLILTAFYDESPEGKRMAKAMAWLEGLEGE